MRMNTSLLRAHFEGKPSLGEIMDENGGVAPGFDFLRIFLATCVLVSHSVLVTGNGRDTIYAADLMFYQLRYLIMPCFFALSGFLVAGSIFRVRNVGKFITLRALRIYPALVVEIVLSVFVLGLWISTSPIVEYITDKKSILYLFNISGLFIHYELPGVFDQNPYKHIVNGSLWTVPSEMKCYASLAILMATNFVYRTRWLVALFAIASGAIFVMNMDGLGLSSTFTSNNANLLVVYFYAGVLCFIFRHSIRVSIPLIVVSVLYGVVAVLWEPALLVLGGPLAAAYTTCCFGFMNIRLPALLRSGDYSYGIYLYGFPIQQTIVWLTHDRWTWWENFGVSWCVSLAFAAFSWHLIEKRCLLFRKRIGALPTGAKNPSAAAATVFAR